MLDFDAGAEDIRPQHHFVYRRQVNWFPSTGIDGEGHPLPGWKPYVIAIRPFGI